MTATTPALRPFAAGDYGRLVAIERASAPDRAAPEADWRRRDGRFDHARYFRRRVVAELGGTVAGWGQIGHNPSQFYPDKYRLDLTVDPAARGRGVGTALYDRLMAELAPRHPEAVRAQATEAQPGGVRFLTERGFVERSRSWESHLDVLAFDFAPFASADDRVAAHGVEILTWAELRDSDGEAAWRRVYDLNVELAADVPALDPITAAPFDWFSANILSGPQAIPEGYFVARIGDELVGVSELRRHKTDPSMLHQNLTGVRRHHRGKGIAMALKLRTLRYAQAHGFRTIQTWNNVNNQPILRVNDALGFAKQPAWIEFEKPFR